VLLLTAMLAPAAPAFAHAALVSSQPGAGYAVTTAPNEILLQFSEQVSLTDDALTLTGPAGREVPLQVALDPTRTAVRGLLPDEIALGAYEVGYSVVARDGDLITGSPLVRTGALVGAGGSAGLLLNLVSPTELASVAMAPDGCRRTGHRLRRRLARTGRPARRRARRRRSAGGGSGGAPERIRRNDCARPRGVRP
jgi:methionine-rich copper-binding protein CopC